MGKYLTTSQFITELNKLGIKMELPNLRRIIKAGQIESKNAAHGVSNRPRHMIPQDELKKFTQD